MIKIIAFVLLVACFCSAELCAREAVGQVMPSAEVKQEISRGVSLGDRQAFNACPLRSPGQKTPPFPVLIPKAIVYPRRAVRHGWEGKTVVAAEVLPDGSVGRTAVAKSSGHKVLDQAAQEAIGSWEFGTESEKNEGVPQYVDIPVTFKLQSED
jgi:TonB family protein